MRVCGSYICRRCSRSPGFTASLRGSGIVLHRPLPLGGILPVGRFALFTGTREESPTEATFVGRVATAFDWYAAWTGHIGRLRALRTETETQTRGLIREPTHWIKTHLRRFNHVELYDLTVSDTAQEFPRIVFLDRRLNRELKVFESKVSASFVKVLKKKVNNCNSLDFIFLNGANINLETMQRF